MSSHEWWAGSDAKLNRRTAKEAKNHYGSILYDDYRRFCKAQGSKPYSRKRFIAEMTGLANAVAERVERQNAKYFF